MIFNMSDFSNKYKSAVDEMKISPDFKERTEKMMIELRDSESTHKRSKIKLYKGLSAAAAAAACIAVAFSLNRTGVFDKNSDPAVIVTDTIETQALETSAAQEPVEETAPAAAEYDSGEADVDSVDEYSIAADISTPIPDFTEPVYESSPVETYETVVTDEQVPATTSASAAAVLQGPHVTEAAKSKPSVHEETKPVTDEAEQAEEAVDDGLFLESAEYTPPAGTYPAGEYIPDNDYDDSEELSPSLPEAGEGAVSDDDNISSTVVSEIARAEDFSAKEAVSGFKAASSSAVIIPSVSGYDDDGSVTSYSSRKIRGIKDLNSLEKELYIYTEDQTASAVTAIPSDSSYIVDLADDQGNSLRIYIGRGYICFSLTDGSLFSYDLSDEEYNSVDSFILSLIA